MHFVYYRTPSQHICTSVIAYSAYTRIHIAIIINIILIDVVLGIINFLMIIIIAYVDVVIIINNYCF